MGRISEAYANTVYAAMAPQAFGQLGGAAESAWQAVQADLKAKMAEFNSQPGVIDGLKGFAAAVDWTVSFLSYACTGQNHPCEA